MVWTVTDWTTNPDWADVDNLNEFVDAINERDLANGGAGTLASTISVGDDVQIIEEGAGESYLRKVIKLWQFWTESLSGNFVVSHDDGTPREAGHFNNTAGGVQAYSTLANAFAATDLAHSDFRRYTTHPDETGSVAYGQIQNGDIIGPWIFEDLQKLLNVMVWTKDRDTIAESWINGVIYGGWGDSLETSAAAAWTAAKGVAEGDWGESGDFAFPLAVSSGSIEDAGGGDYYAIAELHREAANFQITNIWNGVSRDVDWYVFTSQAVWHANEDAVIEDKWSCWLTDAPATANTTVVSSATLSYSATFKPIWCAQPDVDGSATRGWDAKTIGYGFNFVVRWNVTNGFVYQ